METMEAAGISLLIISISFFWIEQSDGNKKPRAVSGAGFQEILLLNALNYPAPRLAIRTARIITTTAGRAASATRNRRPAGRGRWMLSAKLSVVKLMAKHHCTGKMPKSTPEINIEKC